MIPFDKLYASRIKSGITKAPECLLALDPGGTTGYAIFTDIKFQEGGQLATGDVEGALLELTELFDRVVPTTVIMEDYRVYAHRQEQHVGSSLQTSRLIGMIETLCHQRKIPYHKQMAGLAKGFVKNDHLKYWSMWTVNARHALDATRHGIYFILYPPKTVESKVIQRRPTTGQRVG